MLLKACLNGARPVGAHPALPVTPDALAEAARRAVAAGAGAIHLHPRGDDGAESLDGAAVGAAVAAVRAAVPGTPVGVTTGAWVEPDVERRLAAVAGWRELPDFASVNTHEDGMEAVAAALLDRGVGVEAGIWTVEAAERLVASGFSDRLLRCLLEPRADAPQAALDLADAIVAVLDRGGVAAPRLLHGSRATAWPLVRAAIARGLDTRIGLEDVLELPDGSPAPDNAALVAAAMALVDGTA